MLRKQVSSTQQANMYAEFRDVRWDPVESDFLLGNGGPAIARNIRIWLEAGDTVAESARRLSSWLRLEVARWH